MKTKLLIVVIVFIAITSKAQNSHCQKDYLQELPKDLKLDKSIQQKYIMTTNYVDLDMLGNFKKETKFQAEYTCGLENEKVRWNNVFISKRYPEDQSFNESKNIVEMEGFSYVPSEKMLNPELFPTFSSNTTQLQNLVWDMMAFEIFAWEYFDSLKLNKEFVAESANTEVDLAGVGTFENKDIRLNWNGITKMNNEICAIIEYTAMSNPLKIKNDFIDIKGRSHYWGYVYVSMEDKQIEFAMMNEDVIMELKFPNQDKVQRANTIRKIIVNKIL